MLEKTAFFINLFFRLGPNMAYEGVGHRLYFAAHLIIINLLIVM
jgi:hypothetical protein